MPILWFCDRIGKPFVRELVIEEAPETESFYAKEDGAGKDLPPVAQMTGLKLRYFPPGAQMEEGGEKQTDKVVKDRKKSKEKKSREASQKEIVTEKKDRKQKKGKRETKGKSKPYNCL